MARISSYKCPSCGANIPFDSDVGTLKCQYCGTNFDVDDLDSYNVEQHLKADSFEWETIETKLETGEKQLNYVCPSCTGVVIANDNTSASSCPYCGTSLALSEKLEGSLKPDMIIPFKLKIDDVKKAYFEHIKNKKYLPDDFKLKNIFDNLTGIYVPYWLFDADADGQARFRATRNRSYREGNYNVTETSHFLVYRDGSASFEKVPVDASTKLDDALLDALEPFDYTATVDFNSAYLSGFFSEKYDQDVEKSKEKANYRIKNSMTQMLYQSVIGYNSVVCESSSVQFSNGKSHYALLPVYIMNTKYEGRNYQFAFNGQTGKFVGDLPCDKRKVWFYSIRNFFIFFAAFFAILYFVLK